jgi:hypothetical protein
MSYIIKGKQSLILDLKSGLYILNIETNSKVFPEN